MAAAGNTQDPRFPGRGESATLGASRARGDRVGIEERAPRASGDERRRGGLS